MTAFLRRARQRGAGRLELAVSITLFAIVAAVFLERILYYQDYAEMTAMEMTVANMRSGLRYKVADLIMNNRLSEISTLIDENPIRWLSSLPENYLGEYDAAPQTAIEGKWYFDRTKHELVYTPNNRRHFVPSSGEHSILRYRAMPIKPQFSLPKGSRPQTWVSLVQLQP